MPGCCSKHEDTETWETREFVIEAVTHITCTGCEQKVYPWKELGFSSGQTHDKCTQCLFSDLKNEGFEECIETTLIWDYAIFNKERIYTSKAKNARKK